MPSKIIEISFTEELRQHVDESSQQAAELLSVDRQQDSPRHIVAAIDHWLRQVCGQSAAKRRRPKLDIEESALLLGCLWGEQLVRAFDWQWIRWSLVEDAEDDQAGEDAEVEQEDEVLIAVASADRRLVIYPFHELFMCLDDGAPVKLLLAFDVLSSPERIPELPAGAFENVMENVHHPS